ncbi:TcaA NTF2-like domain-containing protein [Halobacillus andaensis]|uniref:TcaA NTF2-like domain-containing protein n=1 Tax=Halobacillus andaensis TaxID=1176239 RepID=UPI003D748628
MKGEAKNEFGRFEYADDIYVGFSPAELFIEFPDQTYTIQTDQPDATLIINGKSTSKTLSEFEELGPFPENEVVMYAERTNREGKIERTEEVTQNDTVWGSLPFDFNQEDYEYEEDEDVIEEDNNSVDAGNYVMEFRNAYEEALNAVDYSYISSYLIEGSEAALELQDYLTEIDSQGYTFNFTHNEVTSLEQMDEETSIVTTNERFTFTDQDGKETFYDRVKDYTLISMDNGLKITSIDINETIRN